MRLHVRVRLERRRPPTTFVSAAEHFVPEVDVCANRDVSGWVDRREGVKWHIPAGQIVSVDADTARVLEVKGYAEVIQRKEHHE